MIRKDFYRMQMLLVQCVAKSTSAVLVAELLSSYRLTLPVTVEFHCKYHLVIVNADDVLTAKEH